MIDCFDASATALLKASSVLLLSLIHILLKSGKMPAPARIVQEDIVGPSLGQESINQEMCIRDRHYLDSMQNEKVYLGSYTLKQCREMEIGLGLDLKGGIDVYKRQRYN